jgi:hypothetical protein
LDGQITQYHEEYINDMLAYQSKAKGLRVGYVPGVIRHHYHGSKKNRQYGERWKILVNYGYVPSMIRYENGIIVPKFLNPVSDATVVTVVTHLTPFPQGLADEILQYFSERNEDEP